MRLDDFKNKSPLYAVIFGGRGYEHSISCISGANFISVAKKCGYAILPIGITPAGDFCIYLGECSKIKDGSWVLDTERHVPTYPARMPSGSGFFADGELISVECAVPVLHGDFGEDGTVQGALETAGIAFAGCDTVAGAVAADKAYSKAVATVLGIPTLPWITFSEGNFDKERAVALAEEKIGYPMFVKPCRLGSSIGASAAYCREQLLVSIESALSCENRIMIERALLRKAELECAYFETGGKKTITPPAMINIKDGFYDYNTKYSSNTASIAVRADVSEDVKQRLLDYTEKLAGELSVRQIARFDYFLDGDGEIFFNEVNTFPGMTPSSLYLAMLGECGVSAEEVIGSLLGGGIW
jgi:D-alanine-D-alanine ligase